MFVSFGPLFYRHILSTFVSIRLFFYQRNTILTIKIYDFKLIYECFTYSQVFEVMTSEAFIFHLYVDLDDYMLVPNTNLGLES